MTSVNEMNAYERGKREEKERMKKWVIDNSKEFVAADNVQVGGIESDVWKFVPKEDGMWCLNCTRFIHEEGCNCGSFWKDDLLKAIEDGKHESS